MKQLAYLFVLIILSVLLSCKKESTASTEQGNKLNSKDPVALSKNIKVWHGIRSPGLLPEPKGGGAIQIEATNDNIYAFAGRFAITKPNIINGNVAGFYIAIKGAKEYFKVDYTKQLITEKRNNFNLRKQINPHIGFKPDSTGNNLGDSAIVVILPPNISTPDTICITYSAFDDAGNVSNQMEECIILLKAGGDGTTNWFSNGIWSLFASKDSANKPLDTILLNKWRPVFQPTSYYCNTVDSVGQTEVMTYCYDGYSACNLLNVTDSVNFINLSYEYKPNGVFLFSDSAFLKDLNISQSTCSNIKFNASVGYGIYDNGGWSVIGDKLFIIYEFDENGFPAYDFFVYTYKKINDNEFWLIGDPDPASGGIDVFKKL